MHTRNFLIAYTLWVIILFLLVLCAVGCTKTVKSVEYLTDTLHVTHERIDTIFVNHVRVDTINNLVFRHDSIYHRDSIFVHSRNDTVYIYKERWNTQFQIRHDTVYKHFTDTLVVFKTATQSDSTNHFSVDNHETVKVKRSWNWLSYFGFFCLLGGIALFFFFWQKK